MLYILSFVIPIKNLFLFTIYLNKILFIKKENLNSESKHETKIQYKIDIKN